MRLYFKASDQLRHLEVETKKPADRGGKETILVVDDRQEVAELAMDMLLTLGYEVVLSTTAVEALNTTKRLIAQDKAPDLLFSDIIMPGGMNGVLLAREIRKLIPNLPVLLTTGYAGSPDRNLDKGVEFEVINKPYKMADLAKKVRFVLEGPTVLQRR